MFGDSCENRNQKLSKLFNKSNEKKRRRSERKHVEMNPLKYFKCLLRVFNANRWVSQTHCLLYAKETVREKEKFQIVCNVLKWRFRKIELYTQIDSTSFVRQRNTEMKLNVIGQRFHINHTSLIVNNQFFVCILSIKWFVASMSCAV